MSIMNQILYGFTARNRKAGKMAKSDLTKMNTVKEAVAAKDELKLTGENKAEKTELIKSAGLRDSAKPLHFKVMAISTEQPIGGLQTERGVIMTTLDGETWIGRVNLLFHDVMIGDTVWVERWAEMAGSWPKWISIGFSGADKLLSPPKVVVNKVWTRPLDRGKKSPAKPAWGFMPCEPVGK